jgi:uncharacterized repeat protein (TIGR04052 family)
MGVPFEQNHQNAATAGAPLNITSMFWNWQGGYKFMRVDGKTSSSAGFRVHLGSTACESPEGSSEVTGCENENRVRVRLEDFDVDGDRVVFDAGALFEGVDMTPDADGKSAICMSTPEHEVCGEIFRRMGLDFGEVEGGDVLVFAVER